MTLNDNNGTRSKCTVEVLDNHLIPEIRIGPVEEAYKGLIAEFDDWAQFERFVEAVNGVYGRLKGAEKNK
ncbi:MAG: hypothetical protein AABY51_03110 [Deltaproteobacteria bacterium]